MPATPAHIFIGSELLHFNPNTGRIVRCVKVVAV
jgi:hypothetical protein